MNKIKILWGGTPISENELQEKLKIHFWEPKIMNSLPLEEQRNYLELKWWDSKVQPLLTKEAKDFFRSLDEAKASVRFGELALTEQLKSNPDPLSRLEETNDAVIMLMAELNNASQLRRETLLEIEKQGVPTRTLADILHISLPRVRQLIIDAKRKCGLPVTPQMGGRKKSGV